MPLLFGILVSAGVIFAIFAVTVGRGGSMTQFQPDWPGRPLPQERPVRASDLADARFSVAFRGYRMAEVDEALDRLAAEIAQRDEQIQQLTGHPFEAAPLVAPTAGAPAAHDPNAYDPSADNPNAYQSGGYDPNAYDRNAYDTSVYQRQPVEPTAEPPAYEPHGYPPGVLDLGGHPTQPIPPVTDPGTTHPDTAPSGEEG